MSLEEEEIKEATIEILTEILTAEIYNDLIVGIKQRIAGEFRERIYNLEDRLSDIEEKQKDMQFHSRVENILTSPISSVQNIAERIAALEKKVIVPSKDLFND
jgi:hypothetical protein